MARKRFCTVTAKLLKGNVGGETLSVYLNRKKRQEAIAFASGIFQALALGKGIDITLTQKDVRKGHMKLTVTSHT
jgi:hypothetical protein